MLTPSINAVRFPEVSLQAPNWVNGNESPSSGARREVISPYTGKRIGTFNESTTAEIDVAIQSASVAFPKWKSTPIKERCQVLFHFRQILLRDLEELSHSVSRESGKTLSEARAGLLKGVEVIEFALSLQNRDEGGKLEVSRGVFCEYRREPLGVVAGITPFNFPAMVPLWMIPIAIALGNCFVWKPSDKTPLTSLPIAKALKEAGLPDGVFTVIQGGKEAVEAILDHPKVAAVGFVGSTPVARAVYTRGTQHGKRILALGGAKNHIILMPDADPDMAAKGIADSFTGCAGQRCMAASVLLAVGDTDRLIQGIVEKASQIRISEDMGAIITVESKKKIESAIQRAKEEGATLPLDGRTPNVPSEYVQGNWLAPTIIDHVQRDSHAAKEELFGPVLSIIRVKNLSEAIAIENSSEFGNAASVFTNTGAIAERVAREAQVGMVGVNIGVPVPREPFSFGGICDSKFGQGDITGPSSLDFWSNLKKITTKWSMNTDHNWMS